MPIVRIKRRQASLRLLCSIRVLAVWLAVDAVGDALCDVANAAKGMVQ